MTRRTDGVGQVVEGIGALFTDRGRIRASKTVGVETVGYGIFEVTFRANGDAKSFKQVHWGTASGARRGIILDEVAATGTADLMGYIVRGVKGDEGDSGIQADKANGRTKIDQKGHGGGHDSATQRLRRGVYFGILTYVTW